MKSLFILNEDFLNPKIFEKQYPDNCDMVFPWDLTYFNKKNFSFKQLMFMYECLTQTDVLILKGTASEIIQWYQSEYDELQVYITYPPREQFHDLDKEKFKILKPDDLIKAGHRSFNRFFPFWKYVKKQLTF